MKKLIIISAAFALIIALSFLELCFEIRVYSALREDLIALKVIVQASKEQVNTPESAKAYDEANQTWRKHDTPLFFTTNHSVIRGINEKLAYLEDFLLANAYPDVLSTVNALIDTTEYMIEEKYPLLGNIF